MIEKQQVKKSTPKHKSKYEQYIGLVADDVKEDWAKIQAELHKQLITTDKLDFTVQDDGQCKDLKLVGAVDISVSKFDQNLACAAYVVCEYPSLKVVYKDMKNTTHQYPYIPGFLAFRQVPVLLDLIQKQRNQADEFTPQVILVDGNGIFHTREFGFASQLGVEIDIPTIGVGKTVFSVDGLNKKNVRDICNESLKNAQDAIELVGVSGKVWGAGFKSTSNCIRPLILSIGHRISLSSAIAVVRACIRDIRVPIPIQIADKSSRNIMRDYEKANNLYSEKKGKKYYKKDGDGDDQES